MPAPKPNRYVLRPSKAALRQQCRDLSHETPSQQKRQTTAQREDRPRNAHAQANRRSQAQAGQQAEQGKQKASNASGQKPKQNNAERACKRAKTAKMAKARPFQFHHGPYPNKKEPTETPQLRVLLRTCTLQDERRPAFRGRGTGTLALGGDDERYKREELR